MEATKLRF